MANKYKKFKIPVTMQLEVYDYNQLAAYAEKLDMPVSRIAKNLMISALNTVYINRD